MNTLAMFKTVAENDYSDLHLSVGLPPMIRKGGSLEPLGEEVLSNEKIEKILKEILPPDQMVELARGKEYDLGITVGDDARFRANIYFDNNGICVAFRPISKVVYPLDLLGLPPAVGQICEYQRGLVLVTGPTGSGKSTTLASMIEHINRNRKCHIISLEDPIEYVHTPKRAIINQRAVGRDTASFSSGLRAALREDPDVILVGEMRDLETISNAITAAETGHLVFATLHTRDAVQSVTRIIDVFPADQQSQIRVQFAESVAAVISQFLIPGNTGAQRYLAAEIMLSNMAIRNLIRENKIHHIRSVIESSSSEGMQTMDISLKRLVEGKKIDIRLAKQLAFDRQSFK